MHRVSRVRAAAWVVGACLLPAGCGGSGGHTVQAVPKDPFAYDASKPLQVRVTKRAVHGPVSVRDLTYAAVDGTRVPALFATPNQRRSAGCLIYQPGRGTPKEAAASIWPAAARLGLGVFTIDPRYTGARASVSMPLNQVLSTPQGLVPFLRNDVTDLRRGLDYLERQPACHHNVGYMGISEGAVLGVLLAGADTRVRATVLCSIAATWRAALYYLPVTLQGVAGNAAKARAALAELAPLDEARWIRKISPRPVMIVAGLSDPYIPVSSALQLAAAARPPKLFVLHAGGHDPFAGPSGPKVAERIVEFLREYLVHRSPAA